jgi:hypothetical protein
MRSTLTLLAAAGIALLAFAGSTSASSGATRSPSATPAKHLTITALGQLSGLGGPASGRFELLGSSAADSDAGKLVFTAPTDPLPRKTAEGLSFRPLQLTETLKGRHGTLVVRSVVRLFDVVKQDDSIATGTWSVVRGTGSYAGLKGGGALVGITQPAAAAGSNSDYQITYRYEGRDTR